MSVEAITNEDLASAISNTQSRDDDGNINYSANRFDPDRFTNLNQVNNVENLVQNVIDALGDIFTQTPLGQLANRLASGDLTYDTSKKSYVDDDPAFPGDVGMGYGRNYYSETDLRSVGDNLPDKIANPTNNNRIAMANARIDRAKALVNKQKELAEAFGAFNDDYFEDLSESYTSFQTPLLDTALGDAERGLYNTFKSKGLLTQAEVDQGLGSLLEQKAVDAERIQTGANQYAQAKRDEVATTQQKLADSLSGMIGGASTLDEIQKQTQDIQNFDVHKSVDKLNPAATKPAMTFFDGFDKIALSNAPMENVDPVSSAGVLQTGTITPAYTYTGINDTYRGSSQRVVS